ncbi:hypothetical protein AB0937_02920 [Streptomyces sp. NPDC047880]|uniref:hypothetical protein n=1 Tax=Streptomyces sp. NPDC047880 TaxID=3155626 RepID=UPI003453D85F
MLAGTDQGDGASGSGPAEGPGGDGGGDREWSDAALGGPGHAEAARLASDFTTVLGESEATYGG